MLDSEAQFVEAPRRVGTAEQAVNFEFPILWTTVFVALDSPNSALTPTELRENPVSESAGEDSEDRQTNQRESTSRTKAQWEMVIPKMVRTIPRASPTPEIESSPPPPPAPRILQAVDKRPSSEPQIVRDAVPPLKPPSRAKPALASSLATKLFVGGALAAGLAIPVFLHVYYPQRQVSIDPSARGGSIWTREISAPIGAKQARHLVLYRPSTGSTDGRLEFTWKVSDHPLGWIFRVKDKDNYYAMVIKALRPGPSAALSVEHFTVFQGMESQHASKVLIVQQNSQDLQIKMDVSGPTFKLYLEGNAADYWTDNRLTAGALGFLEQPDQPTAVQAVRMWFSQTGGA